MFLGIMGFVLLIGIMVILFGGKIAPAVAFIIPPVIFGAILGYSPVEIAAFIQQGVGTTTGTAILFIFSIPFFGIMNELGVFDPIVDKLVKFAGENFVYVTIATVLIAVVSHLDGAAASTALVTVPAMLPIYKKLGIRPQVLVLLIAISAGVLNIVPWGGPTIRAAAMLGIDAHELWIPLIPIQVLGLLIALGAAVYFGITEKKKTHLAFEYYAKNEATKSAGAASETEKLPMWRLLFNWALIIIVIWLLSTGNMASSVIFMVALGLALFVNYPNLKTQQAALERQSKGVVTVAVVLLASGALVGILNGTYMLENMGHLLLTMIPDAWGQFYYVFVGALAAPIAVVFGTDAYFFGLQPIITEVGTSLGHSAQAGANLLLIGHNSTVLVSPMTPAMFLLIGLAGVDLKDHLRFSIPWAIGISYVFVAFGFMLGII